MRRKTSCGNHHGITKHVATLSIIIITLLVLPDLLATWQYTMLQLVVGVINKRLQCCREVRAYSIKCINTMHLIKRLVPTFCGVLTSFLDLGIARELRSPARCCRNKSVITYAMSSSRSEIEKRGAMWRWHQSTHLADETFPTSSANYCAFGRACPMQGTSVGCFR